MSDSPRTQWLVPSARPAEPVAIQAELQGKDSPKHSGYACPEVERAASLLSKPTHCGQLGNATLLAEAG